MRHHKIKKEEMKASQERTESKPKKAIILTEFQEKL